MHDDAGVVFVGVDVFRSQDIQAGTRAAGTPVTGADIAGCRIAARRAVGGAPIGDHRRKNRLAVDRQHFLLGGIDLVQDGERRRRARTGVAAAAPARGRIQIARLARVAAAEWRAFHRVQRGAGAADGVASRGVVTDGKIPAGAAAGSLQQACLGAQTDIGIRRHRQRIGAGGIGLGRRQYCAVVGDRLHLHAARRFCRGLRVVEPGAAIALGVRGRSDRRYRIVGDFAADADVWRGRRGIRAAAAAGERKQRRQQHERQQVFGPMPR